MIVGRLGAALDRRSCPNSVFNPIDAAACEVGNEIRAVFRDEVFVVAEDRVFDEWLPRAGERITAYVDAALPLIVDAAVERAKARLRDELPGLLSESVARVSIPMSAKIAVAFGAVAVFAAAAFSFAAWRRARR